MKRLFLLLLFTVPLWGQAPWYQVCNGTSTCVPVTGTDYPNPVGFIWTMAYRAADHAIYQYTQCGTGTTAGGIYANCMFKYTPNPIFGSSGTFQLVTDTGSRGDNTALCTAAVTPKNGHALGSTIWDNDHDSGFVGGMLCQGGVSNNYIYNGSSWSDTGQYWPALAAGSLGTYGFNQIYWQAASSTDSLVIQCCSNGNSDTGEPIVEKMLPSSPYTMTQLHPLGANGSLCSSSGTNCPPNVWSGMSMVERTVDRKIYMIGGCNCTDPTSFTPTVNTFYSYDPSTNKFDKPAFTIAGGGSLPAVSFPLMVYNSNNDSIWLYLVTNTVWNCTFSDMTCRQTITTGGPAVTTQVQGNRAAYDPNTNRAIIFPGASGLNSLYWWEYQFGPIPATMRSGTGIPSNSVGNDGDLYHRTDSPYQSIYGPKASGVWPSEFSYVVGQGCTTVYHIDKDCDGYGNTRPTAFITDPNPLFGDDGDDNDATVNTPASVISKYGTISSFLTHLGYPTNRIYYIDGTSGDNANFATYGCSVDHPCLNYGAVAASMADGNGGTVLVRAGTYATGLSSDNCTGDTAWPCVYPTATTGKQAVLMAYPGEYVKYTGQYAIVGSSDTYTEQNVVWDGFHLINGSADLTGSSNGDAAGGRRMQGITWRNIECAGYNHCWQPSAGGIDITIEQSIFHDTTSHALYPVTGNSSGGIYSTSLFDCAGWTWDSSGWNPFFNLVTKNNIFLYSGTAGLEAIHYNAQICGGAISGNIIVGGGGTGVGLQTGVQDVQVTNNVIANNSASAITLYDYGCDNNGTTATAGQIGGVCSSSYGQTLYLPNMLNGNKIVNNTIWTGTQSPNGISPVCQTSCSSPSTGILASNNVQGTPDARWIKNTTIQNNVIVTFNSGTGFSSFSAYPQFLFSQDSWPETNTIKNNLLYNAYTGNSQAYVMHIASAADCTSANNPYWMCTGAGTWSDSQTFTAYPGDYSWTTFQSYNTSGNANNRWGDPLFVNSGANLANPNRWNFRVTSGSPAIASGLGTGAPSTDITGVLRSSTVPTIGAYETGGGTPVVGGSVVSGNVKIGGKAVVH